MLYFVGICVTALYQHVLSCRSVEPAKFLLVMSVKLSWLFGFTQIEIDISCLSYEHGFIAV